MAQDIKFYKTDSVEPAAKSLYQTIDQKLKQGQKVLWLVSGGSAISVAVSAASLWKDNPVGGLSVALIDERYGPVGHPDSNWAQLTAAGFSLPGASLRPVLNGDDAAATTASYNQFIEEALVGYNYKIALLGIGADGHTAGILPHSPAVDSADFVSYYQASDYQRITLTPKGLAILDEIIVFAPGAAKLDAISDLRKDLSIADQPAQAIKNVSRLSVYSSLGGE
jgi:6-phosphogluconolactonase/glucosamine-6-phosphate isomerase/deaminase